MCSWFCESQGGFWHSLNAHHTTTERKLRSYLGNRFFFVDPTACEETWKSANLSTFTAEKDSPRCILSIHVMILACDNMLEEASVEDAGEIKDQEDRNVEYFPSPAGRRSPLRRMRLFKRWDFRTLIRPSATFSRRRRIGDRQPSKSMRPAVVEWGLRGYAINSIEE